VVEPLWLDGAASDPDPNEMGDCGGNVWEGDDGTNEAGEKGAGDTGCK